MKREDLIDALVQAHIDSIFEAGVEVWISERLRHGMSWKAYEDMTDAELMREYSEVFSEEAA